MCCNENPDALILMWRGFIALNLQFKQYDYFTIKDFFSLLKEKMKEALSIWRVWPASILAATHVTQLGRFLRRCRGVLHARLKQALFIMQREQVQVNYTRCTEPSPSFRAAPPDLSSAGGWLWLSGSGPTGFPPEIPERIEAQLTCPDET